MATLRNTIVNDTGSVYLPFGTTAQRPAAPVDGDMRFNTSLGYIEYYYRGFWINAETNRGSVPPNGLLCLLDVDNLASYPGTGTVITNIGGSSAFNGTINGTVTLQTTATGSRFLSGGTGASITIPMNVSSLTNNTFTVMTVTGYNGATRGRITTTIQPGGNNWLLGHWSAGDVRYFAEGWITQESSSGTGAANNQWGVHVGTGESRTDQWEYWKNGGYRGVSINGGSQGPTSLGINGWSSEASDWRWQFLAVWNRVLTGEEIVNLSGLILARGGF